MEAQVVASDLEPSLSISYLSLVPFRGKWVQLGSDITVSNPHNLPLATGAGRGAGAWAGGVPAGDPAAGGAAPPGSPAAGPRPPRQRCKSACHGLQAYVGEQLVIVFLNFIFNNIFAFYVHGNDSRHSWMRRYVSSVSALSTCMAGACDIWAVAHLLLCLAAFSRILLLSLELSAASCLGWL